MLAFLQRFAAERDHILGPLDDEESKVAVEDLLESCSNDGPVAPCAATWLTKDELRQGRVSLCRLGDGRPPRWVVRLEGVCVQEIRHDEVEGACPVFTGFWGNRNHGSEWR